MSIIAALDELVLDHGATLFVGVLLTAIIGVTMYKSAEASKQFSSATQSVAGKYVSASGDCKDVRWDPKRNQVFLPTGCKLAGLDR